MEELITGASWIAVMSICIEGAMMKVLIVGAGPAGLTTAVERARRGIVSEVKEIIAGSEAVRKAITSRNPLTRFLVLAVLRSASFVPMLQRQFAKKILYG